ncbi:disulfide bond formation protein B [Aestuariivirga sp.]|uniref:disulfide bond formation protein B n=1 Tax=Aestuariivirga sp. TaxID=2650926 RepID=UPI0039E67BDA
METSQARALALLNHLYLIGMVVVISGILTAAMVMQYAFGELPCPLCLLERLALFGCAFGILQNLRGPFSDRNTGWTLLFALFLLIVSVRQSLLDIYVRPGHAYIGSAVFGLHMPVWAVVIALCLMIAIGVRLAVLGGNVHMQANDVASFPVVQQAARLAGWYVIILCAINFVSVIIQCGLGQCHTMGYALLEKAV